jgi:hypothetical protein
MSVGFSEWLRSSPAPEAAAFRRALSVAAEARGEYRDAVKESRSALKRARREWRALGSPGDGPHEGAAGKGARA